MVQESGNSDFAAIVTPGGRGFLSALGSNPTVLAFAARLGLALRRLVGKPLRFRNTVIAVTFDDVRQVFARDLDFRIAPINETKIDEVNDGPFILGMDRSPQLELERRALYSALAAVDLPAMENGLRQRAAALLPTLPDTFDALQDFARPLAAETASQLFGIAPTDRKLFQEVARAVFAHTFLNLGNDKAIRDRALRAAPLMKQWFADEIGKRPSGAPGHDLMGQLLRQGLLDHDGIRRTLGGMFVGSIDTTVTCVANILDVVFRNPDLRASFRGELAAGRSGYGLCLEALRVLPHNPIILREADAATSFAGRTVQPKDRIIAWTQAAMRDSAAFPEPDRLYPDRPAASYLHFGAGLHPCAGRAVNAFQLPILVGALIEAGVARAGKTAFAGPFPDRLPVRVGKDSA